RPPPASCSPNESGGDTTLLPQRLRLPRRDPELNLHPDLSFVAMVAHASVVVQAVMVLLLLLSLWSWWQIFLKMFALKRAANSTDAFEDEFWKGGDLNALYQRASQSREAGAMERIFTAGFRE